MTKYKPRKICKICERRYSQKILINDDDICNRCKTKRQPNLYSLNKVPIYYFEFEKLKINGINTEK